MFFFINVCKNIERQQQIVKIYQFIIITQEYANNEVFKKKNLRNNNDYNKNVYTVFMLSS